LGPISRNAHFVLLLPAAAAGAAAVRLACPGRRTGRALLLAGAFALVVLTAPGLIGVRASRLLMAFCPYSAAALLLIGLLLAAAGPREHAAGATASLPPRASSRSSQRPA